MEKVYRENVAEAAESYSCVFGANKNLYRTIPTFIDGLKPGKRRFFWAWWEASGKPMNTKKETLSRLKFIKVFKLAGDTMGNYHPHASIEEVITSEGQYWNNNVNTIVTQGNFGSIRGDAPANGRYLEAKMSEYLIDCFFDDFNKYCVPMKPSYLGELMEPEYLPAKYPHALFNPQLSGIGYGLASNIISFNVTEVLKATIKLMKDPSAKIYLIPDSPTGADIIDEGLFKQINDTGNGKVVMQASAEINHEKNIIRFTSLPLQTTSMQVISKIIDKKKKGDFQEIVDILDYTKLGEVDLRIVLRSDVNPEKFLRKLYDKGTGLRGTSPVSLKMIDDYRCYEYSVKSFLEEWIEYRRDVVRSMFSNDHIQTLEKQHMNEALLFVFAEDNAETTLKICRKSASRKETIERLMKRYASINLTSLQAATIADMHLYNFNKDTYARYKEEKKKLKEDVERITKTLNDDKLIDAFIINQLEEGIKKYGRPRKSRVIRLDDDDNMENIPDTNHLVAITKDSGIIKKVDLAKTNRIGDVGKKNENFSIIRIGNREDLLLIDSFGMVIRLPVSAIPDMSGAKQTGIEISRFTKYSGDIIGIMRMPSHKMLKKSNNTVSIVFVTKAGVCKRTPLSEFKDIIDSKSGIKLDGDDRVVTTLFVTEDAISNFDMVLFTKNGKGVRIPMEYVKSYGRAAKGNKIVDIPSEDELVGVSLINKNTKKLFCVTSNGYAKVTDGKYFPAVKSSKRSDAIFLDLIPLTVTDRLILVTDVKTSKDVLQVYFKNSDHETYTLDHLSTTTRKAKGEKLVKVPRGESIVSVKMLTD